MAEHKVRVATVTLSDTRTIEDDEGGKLLGELLTSAGLEVVSHAVNFRPAPSDALPLVGEAEPGLVLATGHFRNGILLAPATAEVIADLVLERAPRHAAGAFDPRRFGGVS